MLEIKAPNNLSPEHCRKVYIFMAGSIEMGTAENWHTRFSKAMSDLDVVLLNPRRDDWDSSWKQEKDDPQFREQVEWEQRGIHDLADIVIFYFDPNTKSPITLLELGQVVHDPEGVFVCCPTGFWRKGNVDIVCEAAGIPVFDTLDDLISEVRVDAVRLIDLNKALERIYNCKDE